MSDTENPTLNKQVVSNNKMMAWDKYILGRIKDNKNFLCLVVGNTGSGKSLTCLAEAAKLDPTFTVDRVYFSHAELIKDMNTNQLKRGDAIIIEELGVQMGSRDSLSKKSKQWSYMLQTFRDKGYIVFFNAPNASFVDIHARSLFHAMWLMKSIDFKKQQGIVLPKICQVDPMAQKASKTIYYKYLRCYVNNQWGLRGVTPIHEIAVDKADQALIDAYQQKKDAFTKKLYKDMEKVGDKESEKKGWEHVDYDVLDDFINKGWKNFKIKKVMKIDQKTIWARRKELKEAIEKENKGERVIFP